MPRRDRGISRGFFASPLSRDTPGGGTGQVGTRERRFLGRVHPTRRRSSPVLSTGSAGTHGAVHGCLWPGARARTGVIARDRGGTREARGGHRACSWAGARAHVTVLLHAPGRHRRRTRRSSREQMAPCTREHHGLRPGSGPGAPMYTAVIAPDPGPVQAPTRRSSPAIPNGSTRAPDRHRACSRQGHACTRSSPSPIPVVRAAAPGDSHAWSSRGHS